MVWVGRTGAGDGARVRKSQVNKFEQVRGGKASARRAQGNTF